MNQNKDSQFSFLKTLATNYNTKSFIAEDPIRFPKSYTSKQDIEISAFVSSWIAYGNRKQILVTLEKISEHLLTNTYSNANSTNTNPTKITYIVFTPKRIFINFATLFIPFIRNMRTWKANYVQCKAITTPH